MYEIDPTELAYSAFLARRLIDARIAGDLTAWSSEIDSHAEQAIYLQLAFYFICTTLSDVPDPSHRAEDKRYYDPILISARGKTADAATDLIDGADLIDLCRVTGKWNDAWSKASDDVLWTLVQLVVRTWQFATGDDRRARRRLQASIMSMPTAGWRRMLSTRQRYRPPLRYIRSAYADFQTAGQTAPWLRSKNWTLRPIRCSYVLLRAVVAYVRRPRAYVNPSIPRFSTDGTAYFDQENLR